MKVIIEFDNFEEMEAFRTSGKRTRGAKADKEETEQHSALPSPAPQQQVTTFTPPPVQGNQAQTAFVPPAGAAGQASGFPAPVAQAAQLHPLATAIINRVQSAVAGGQQKGDVVNWFKSQIGPDAANLPADLDKALEQIYGLFIPRMQEPQLKAIAPQLGLAA